MWRIDQRKNLCSTNLRFGAYSASSAWVLYPPASSAVRPNLDPIGPLTSLVQTHHHATSSSALELRLVFSAHRLYSTVFAKGTYGGIEQCYSVCRAFCHMMQVSGVSFKPASLLPVVLMALENGFVLAALLRLLFPYDAMHVSRY